MTKGWGPAALSDWRRAEPPAAVRPDRGGATPLGGALDEGGGDGDGRRHLDHARPPDPDGAAERGAGAARAHLPPLRGADAPLPLAPRLAAAGQDRRAAAG